MLLFNAVISELGLVEHPLKGKSFTWSNMQEEPLLEKLDWFFTSNSWTLHFPSTFIFLLAKSVSDHVPCVIVVNTSIPRSNTFRIENHWLEMSELWNIATHCWQQTAHAEDLIKCINMKFKTLWRVLRIWSKQSSNLRLIISNTNEVILFLDTLEKYRALSIQEWNASEILKDHLNLWLKRQHIYWKKKKNNQMGKARRWKH